MITTEIKLKSSTTNLVGSASCINISSTLKRKEKKKEREYLNYSWGQICTTSTTILKSDSHFLFIKALLNISLHER